MWEGNYVKGMMMMRLVEGRGVRKGIVESLIMLPEVSLVGETAKQGWVGREGRVEGRLEMELR